jgi:hypothetical protein
MAVRSKGERTCRPVLVQDARYEDGTPDRKRVNLHRCCLAIGIEKSGLSEMGQMTFLHHLDKCPMPPMNIFNIAGRSDIPLGVSHDKIGMSAQ